MAGIKMGSYYADKAKAKRNAEVASGDEGETGRQKARMDASTSSERAAGPATPTVSQAPPKSEPRSVAPPAPRAKPDVPKRASMPTPKAKPSTGANREYPKSDSSPLRSLFGRDDERDRLLTARNTGSYKKGGKVR